MSRLRLTFILVAFAVVTPAFAINLRSAVSVTGVDTNPCTPASPCRTFAAAIAQTVAGGEVIALDTAGYGPFTVPMSLTVTGAPGVHAAISVISGTGIMVSTASSDTVTISNLALVSAGGTIGILVPSTGAAEVRVLNCTLQGFTGQGIMNQNGRLTVDRCAIFDSGTAIQVNGTIMPVQAVITNSLLEKFTNGIVGSSDASVQITNCTIAGGDVGVGATSSTGVGSLVSRIFVESSTLSYNTNAIATIASGGNNSAVVYLAQNTITFGAVGVNSSAGGLVLSYGNNRFAEVPTIGTLSPITFH